MSEAWIDTVRLARDMGTVRELYPPGVTSLLDLPYKLFTAVRFALNFLSFEELPKEERPPKRIWLDAEKLGEWFRAVERRREEKYGGKEQSIDDPVENAAAKGLMVG